MFGDKRIEFAMRMTTDVSSLQCTLRQTYQVHNAYDDRRIEFATRMTFQSRPVIDRDPLMDTGGSIPATGKVGPSEILFVSAVRCDMTLGGNL